MTLKRHCRRLRLGRVGKAAEAFRRWHGVYSDLPTRLALGPIGGPVRVGKDGPQIGALIETPGAAFVRPTLAEVVIPVPTPSRASRACPNIWRLKPA
jgi:hypothetical protein